MFERRLFHALFATHDQKGRHGRVREQTQFNGKLHTPIIFVL